MSTKTELIKRVLVRLGEVPVDQTATDAQKSQVEFVFDSELSRLADIGNINFISSNIPDEIDDAIVSIISYRCADDFGASSERYQRLAAGYTEAMRKLESFTAIPYSGQTEIRDY